MYNYNITDKLITSDVKLCVFMNKHQFQSINKIFQLRCGLSYNGTSRYHRVIIVNILFRFVFPRDFAEYDY